jgi:hypothetical protein
LARVAGFASFGRSRVGFGARCLRQQISPVRFDPVEMTSSGIAWLTNGGVSWSKEAAQSELGRLASCLRCVYAGIQFFFH